MNDLSQPPESPALPPWSRSVETLLAELNSTPAGLTDAEARNRLAQTGLNSLEAGKRVGWLPLLLGQFRSPIVLILLFATVVSAILQDWADAAIILVIVAGSALLSFAQEYSAGNATEKLRAQIRVKATVLRDGTTLQAPAEEIVPGDVVLLSPRARSKASWRSATRWQKATPAGPWMTRAARQPLLRSRPGRTMLAMTALVAAIVVALPFSPLAGILDFEPLRLSFLAAIAVIVATYLIAAELVKTWFYRQARS